MQRREFLRAACATAAVTTAIASRAVYGANDRVRLGLTGCGVRGMTVARLMRQAPNVEFVAVCDVYERNAALAAEWAGRQCRREGDLRRLVESQDIDAVVIATPDHWHALATVLACRAGKDVYVEKPLAHNIREGRAMVTAARKHDRVVQTGMQHRSAPHFAEAARIVRSGELGPVHFVRVWNYVNMFPGGIGKSDEMEPPAGLDWNMYLGPAPLVPYLRARFLGTFRWFWDYAGGFITDYGTHRFDSVHQIMGVDSPLSVAATGRRYELRDGGETPDVLQATYEYPGFTLSYEASNLNAHGVGGRTPGKRYYRARGRDDRPHGMAFYGTSGTLFVDRVGYEVYPELDNLRAPDGAPSERMKRREGVGEDATAAHALDFIECVRSRRRPVADVEIGHKSAIVPHLGNIAYRTGRKLRWNAAQESIDDDQEANQLLAREARKPWDLI